MARRDYAKEIAELRERNSSNHAIIELSLRLLSLQAALDKYRAADNEILRYFPVAIIGCVEAYTRLQIKEIVDYGEPFVGRIARLELPNLKIDLNLLAAIDKKTLTVGEFVSHLVSINSLEDVNQHLSVLLDVDFLEELKKTIDPWEAEVKKPTPAEPIITRPEDVFPAVRTAFELRHIFAHEFATARKVSEDEIDWCFSGTVTFLRATKELCNAKLYPNAPLTQSEMNSRAYKDLESAKESLEELLKKIYGELEKDQAEGFAKIQDAWAAFRELTATFEADKFRGGTIAPMIYAKTAEQITLDRKEELEQFLETTMKEKQR